MPLTIVKHSVQRNSLTVLELFLEGQAQEKRELCDQIAMLDDRFVDVVVESQSYRVLAHEAIHALHALTLKHRKLGQEHHELKEEYRGFRERILREADDTL